MVSYRKKINAGKGVSFNVSKSGVSTSFGIKGAKISVGKTGVYSNTSIPGTGIYSRKKISVGSDNTSNSSGCAVGVVLLIAIILILFFVIL